MSAINRNDVMIKYGNFKSFKHEVTTRKQTVMDFIFSNWIIIQQINIFQMTLIYLWQWPSKPLKMFCLSMSFEWYRSRKDKGKYNCSLKNFSVEIIIFLSNNILLVLHKNLFKISFHKLYFIHSCNFEHKPRHGSFDFYFFKL